MRKLLILIPLAAIIPLSSATAAEMQACSNYRTQGEAQAAWEAAGRPASSDRDGDGKVCESLPKATSTPTGTCPLNDRGIAVVRLSKRNYPNVFDHMLDAIQRGKPRVLTIDRANASANRRRALQGVPTRRGYDRDEWPMAMSRESSRRSDIRYVKLSENRGAGSVVGRQLQACPNGTRFFIRGSGDFPRGFKANRNFGQYRPRY